MTKSKGILPKRKKWTAEEDEILINRYPNEKASVIANDLKLNLHIVYKRADRLGLKKSAEFLASEASGRTCGNHGKENRFKKGSVSWNKGTKGLVFGGIQTQFKKGIRPHNYMAVGSERTVDGYIYVKVADPNKWEKKHYLLWQERTGSPPPKNCILSFIDGDKTNIVFENLELVSKKDWIARHTIQQYPEPIKEVIRLSAKLRRTLNEIEQH